MSSDFDFITLLTTVQTNLYRYGGPILIILGTVSCTLSLIVFTQKNLRKNPCSIYLIACNTSNFLLIYTTILFSTLGNGYFIDPSLYNLSFCPFRYYVLFVLDVLSPCYLISASVDRILLTSPNALTRQRSTPRLAYTCIITITLFWLAAHCHILIFTTFVEFSPGYVYCYFLPGIHLTSITYYSLIFKAILIPLLMVTLGLWTVKNIQNVARITPAAIFTTSGTAAAVHGNVRSVHSKDRQLIKILLIDTSIYIVFNIMISVVLIHQQLAKYQPQDYVQSAIQLFLLAEGAFNTYVPFCIGCYTNILVSKTFRHEMKNILTCK